MTSSEYDTNVFLNYPYDREFVSIVDAMMFGTLVCGFSPRSAEESIGGLSSRLDRIISLVDLCKHGIHDLSRSTVADQDRTRLNMPFELGIFYGAMRLGEPHHKLKKGFAFDADTRQGRASFSDISGIDILPHQNQPAVALICVQRYLSTYAEWEVVRPRQALELFVAYSESAVDYAREFGLVAGQSGFGERRSLMASWLLKSEKKFAAELKPT